MTKDELHAFMLSKGFRLKAPHFSCYHHPAFPSIRYKVKKLVLRKERNRAGNWVPAWSSYISALEIHEGKLRAKPTAEQNQALAAEFLAKFSRIQP